MADEDKGRDNWHRVTLRIPPELHQKLVESAGTLSLNAWLIMLLDDAMVSSSFVKRSDSVLEKLNKLREERASASEQKGALANNDALLTTIRTVIQHTMREEIEKALAQMPAKDGRGK